MEKQPVKMFDCEVRHGGDILHSMVKRNVTDREMRVLKAIHGDDAVVNVKEVGAKDVDQREEAFELAVRYSKTSNPRHGKTLVQKVLGVSLDGFERWLADREELAEMERRERREKAQRESAEFAAARDAAEAEVRAKRARRDYERTSGATA
jgi:hypothetical protein